MGTVSAPELTNGHVSSDEMLERLTMGGIERLQPMLLRNGILSLGQIEGLAPSDVQQLIPAVGTRRKLLNLLPADCTAAGPVVFPVRTAPTVTHTAPISSSSAFMRSNTVGSQGSGYSGGKTAGYTRQHTATKVKRPSQYHAAPTATAGMSPRSRSRSESYMKCLKGQGTEFNTEVGGMAKDIAKNNRFHFPREFVRKEGVAHAQGAIPAGVPLRKARKSAATQEFSTPSKRSETSVRSHRSPSRSHRSPSRSSRAHSPPLQNTELPPPPPEERSTVPNRHRPVFVTRDTNDVFVLLTSSKVNMPSDNAMKLEQLLRHNQVSSGMFRGFS